VNEQGKIIGSVQHRTSLNDSNKYTHPIVRVLIIDRGMILLQKRAQDSLIYPGLWDTAITNHVRNVFY
jgi:isopentenyldiphosphate isomerase